MPTLTTTVDARSPAYLDQRQVMLARLDDLDESLAPARARIRARQRVELLLDRDAPFLELHTATCAGLVGGVGPVEGVSCVVVAQEPGAVDGTGDRSAAYRLAGLAATYRLPLVHLAEPGSLWRELHRAGTVVGVHFRPDGVPSGGHTIAVGRTDADFPAQDEHDALRLARLCVRRLGRETPPEPAPSRPPAYDQEDLLGTEDVREVLARILDASEFDEFQPGTGPVAGWGAVYGYPVGVLAGDVYDGPKAARFADLAHDAGTPLVRLAGGTFHVGAFRFAWPGTVGDADATIDPRDTRTALGIALAIVHNGRST
jgi:acyl-CoA carboxylase subunit beta